jgi:tetratricopeptide (TPR) repeat protein
LQIAGPIMSNLQQLAPSLGSRKHGAWRLPCTALILGCLLIPLVERAAAEPLSVGRPDEAINSLNQTIRTDPNNAEAYSILCRVYYLIDNWEQAISNGERAVQLNPQAASYHLWLGRAYGRKAEQTNLVMAFVLARRVVREFERAHQLDPGNWPIRRDLAEFYVLAPSVVGGGEYKAVQLADNAQATDPVGASLIRAMIASKRKDWAEAERQYKEAVANSGGAAGQWLDLALVYRNSKRWPEFDQAVSNALKSPKKSAENLFDAGGLLVQNGRMLPQACEALRTYLDGNSTDEYDTPFRAHYLLGQALEKMGDRKAAIQEYHSALALASNYRPARDALRRLGA